MRQLRSCLLAATAVVLAACGSQPGSLPTTPSMVPPPATASPTSMATAVPSTTSTPAPALSGRVEVWLSWDADEISGFGPVLESFRDEYPGVTLSIAYYASDQVRENLQRAVEEGGGPTLLLGPSMWGVDLWQAGLIQNIGDWITPELHESILPVAWGQAAYQGVVLGLPVELQGVVLYRNTRMVPEPAATVEEMLTTALALREADQQVGASLDFGFLFSGSQLSVCGGEVLDSEGRLGFNRETGLCWLNLLNTLGSAGSATLNTDVDLTDFELARSAWLIDTVDHAPRLSRILGESGLNIDPWPRYEPENRSLIGYVWTENIYFAVGAGAEDLEAGWAFATYLTTRKAQLMLSDPSGAAHLPVIEAAEMESPIQSQAIAALKDGLPFRLISRLDRTLEIMEHSVNLVVKQGGDLASALFLAMSGVSRLHQVPLEYP